MWNSSFIAIISFQNIPKYFCVKYMIYYILLHAMYHACSKRNILNSAWFPESWALFLCKCDPIPISFVSRQTSKSHVRCFCDCRWSYRTAAATSQRRKERHRQQTEHLGLDNNDLKEVRQKIPGLQSVTCCSSCSTCCSPCWSLTLRPVRVSSSVRNTRQYSSWLLLSSNLNFPNMQEAYNK